MASHIFLRVHFVWSTANREPLIKPAWAQRPHAYIGTVLNDHNAVLLEAGGMPDHIHLYASLPATITLADLTNATKANSSRWIKQNFHQENFQWQKGYGAFSVSKSADTDVRAYIQNQPDHHRIKTFQEEYLAFLEKHEVDYDPNYIFE